MPIMAFVDSSLKGLLTHSRKDHRFSEHIKDRFQAVGYTHSLEKHTKVKRGLMTGTRSNAKPPHPKKTVYIDGLTETQYEQMREDEARLEAIER